MKRLLALALLCVALLLSGCDRPAAAPAAPPKGAPTAAQTAAQTAGQTAGQRAGSDDEDVSSLLNDVDKQLDSDDQPPADQD